MAPLDGLLAESAAWERDGIITAEQRLAILARYEGVPAAAQQASQILTWLAVIVAAIGAVVLVAWNWFSIPAFAKILLSTGALFALYAASAIAARTGRAVLAERLAVVAALVAGAVLLVIDDLLHVNSAGTSALLLWTAVIAGTAALTPSAIAAAAAAGIGAWALLVTVAGVSAPWWFLAVWAALALAVERRRDWWAAGAVSFAFGVWMFFLVLSVWADQVTVPAIAAVLAGNWVYTLTALPDARRPAFARATPALWVTMLGLALLLPSGSHRAMSDWRVASSSIFPPIALFAALAAGTFVNVRHAGGWRSRPAGLTIIALLWLLAWLALPSQFRSSPALQWMWTAIFSGAMVHLGAAAVRDAVRTRDFGQLAVGLASIVVFMLIRVMDAHNLVVSGLMLIASAMVLWWLARLWGRPVAAKAMP